LRLVWLGGDGLRGGSREAEWSDRLAALAETVAEMFRMNIKVIGEGMRQ